MLLQSLVDYYEILTEDNESGVPRLGYGKANVSFALNISIQGEILNVIPLKIPDVTGKKMAPQSMTVPEPVKKSVNLSSDFLFGNSSYVLGFDNKGKPQRSKECFESFKELHHCILKDIKCIEARAVLAFVDSWNVEKASENVVISEYYEEISAGANLVFKLDGQNTFIHQNKEIRAAWEGYKLQMTSETKLQCLVTGRRAPIARLHPYIKGVKSKKPTPLTLVSFDKDSSAYESYGRVKDQGLNSPVSEYATFAYGTALNYLLSDHKYKLSVGDTTVVFWAASPQHIYQDFFALMLQPDEIELISTDKQRYERDVDAIREIKGVFEKLASGTRAKPNIEEDTQFFVVGISPNTARIAIRFFVRNNFGRFVTDVSKHYEDMSIEKQYPNEPDHIPLWKLMIETVPPSSKEKASSPLLSGSVMRSILMGLPYPAALYNAVMARIKAEKDISYYKASIIKACISRNNKNKYKEVLTMSLNEKANQKEYVLGRLFAVLEKAQLDANPGIKSTIKDRYFTSACATPATIFPTLLRLSNHHISKAEYGYAIDNQIKGIMEILNVEDNPFPKNFSLEQQGIFILGYYHQKNSFYKK